MHVLARRTMVALLLPLAAACTSRDQSTAHAQGVGDTIGAARRLAVLEAPRIPYTVVALSNPGSVAGSVVFTGTPKGDTIIQIAAEQNGCGKPLVIRRLERGHGRVANAVVWLTDVRAGRAPPLERRFELDNNDCAWDPVVQAAVAGGALNVANSDPLVERAYATNIATGDTVGLAPFTDEGQIIPYDKMLRTPGIYEFSVESRPMSRAWVAVFDHPYFAVTAADGSFSVEGVPPGAHHIRAWHPMLGVADGTVTVAPGGRTTVTLQW